MMMRIEGGVSDWVGWLGKAAATIGTQKAWVGLGAETLQYRYVPGNQQQQQQPE